MSEEFKKLNKTIASFMLTTLAISGSAFANVNENLIASAVGAAVSNIDSGITRSLYAVPSKPVITPKEPIMELYGVPSNPPVVKPEFPIMELYGVPKDFPVIKPNPAPTMELYGVPSNPVKIAPKNVEKILKPDYDIPNKEKKINPSNFDIIKQINKNNKNTDNKLPANYVAPVIIPGIYIQDSE